LVIVEMDRVELRINSAELVTPNRNSSARFRYPHDLGVESIVVKPMCRLGDGHQVHALSWQLAGLGWFAGVHHSWVRFGSLNLLGASIGGIDTRKMSSQCYRGLSISCGSVPGQFLLCRLRADPID